MIIENPVPGYICHLAGPAKETGMTQARGITPRRGKKEKGILRMFLFSGSLHSPSESLSALNIQTTDCQAMEHFLLSRPLTLRANMSKRRKDALPLT